MSSPQEEVFIHSHCRERERERDCVCTSIVLSNFQLSTMKHNDILATKFTHCSGNNVTNHLPTTQWTCNIPAPPKRTHLYVLENNWLFSGAPEQNYLGMFIRTREVIFQCAFIMLPRFPYNVPNSWTLLSPVLYVR
jgi:hypothetical protein